MSQSIDSRVVEMRFDNKEFEANAQETLNTLENLKRALNENVSGEAFNELDKAARNVDLSGIQSGIETLTDRFSTMGIVGMTVIQNITNALTHTLGNAVRSVFDTIVSGGVKRAQNIENARFQLQGILNDEEKVNEVFKNASESVDGTAYALDSAANAASQLAASGVEAGEQMTNVLKGIAGVAATTSTDYEGISRIFTQVAGNGRLMGDQLLQLSSRGLNAAATLKDYFNGVKNGSIEATEAVKKQIAALTGAKDLIKDSTDAISEAAELSYDEAKKASNKEYKLKQKQYNNEYKELQKSLNEQYNLKKKAYDEEYKALQESLNKEIQAVQEANAQRIEELNEKYQADVEAYREATNQKISLINEEYKESIKLIDEERYEKIKAVDDQIKAIQDKAKAEQKALRDAANAEKKADLESILSKAKSNRTKQQAAQALADFEAELAREQAAEDREKQIENLQEEKNNINEEAQKKKEEAQKKAESAREAVQTESTAELKAMQKAHEEEMKQVRKEQQEQLEQMRNSNAERLQALRENQTEELSIYKEGQNAELEAFRDKQSEELEAFKEFQNEYLEELKNTAGKASKYAAKFGGVMDVTEGDIRDMITDGLISFDIFSEAMATTFGEHAYDANKTFQGALSNIKAALARTGAMFVSPLISEGAPLIDLLNAIRIRINEINKVLTPIAEIVTGAINEWIPKLTERFNQFRIAIMYTIENARRGNESVVKFTALGESLSNILYSIGNILVAIASYIKPIIDAFREVFSLNFDQMKESTDTFREFTEGLKASDEAASLIKNTFKSLFGIIKKLIGGVKNLIKPLSKLIGWIIKGVESVIEFTAGFANLIPQYVEMIRQSEKFQAVMQTVTSWVDKFIEKVVSIKNVLKSSFNDSFGGFDIGKYFSQGFIEGIKAFGSDVITGIIAFVNSIKDKVCELFGIHSPSEWAKWVAEMIIKGFMFITELTSNAVKVAVGVFKDVVKAIAEFFSQINWEEIFASVSEAATTFIERFSKSIADGIPKAGRAIQDFFTNISKEIKNHKFGEESGNNFVLAFISGVANALKALAYGIRDIFLTFIETLSEMFHNFSAEDAITTSWIWVSTFVSNFIKIVKEFASPIADAFGKLFSSITPGGVVSMAAGISVIYGLTQMFYGIARIINPIDSLRSSLIGINKALKGLSFDYIATGILKISGAISLLMFSIVMLYKNIDEEHANKLDTTLLILGGIIGGVAYLAYKIIELESTVTQASTAMSHIAKGLKAIELSMGGYVIIKALTSAFKTIVGSLVVLVILNNQYGNDMKEVVPIMNKILLILVSTVGVFLAVTALLAKLTDKVPELRQSSKDMTTSFLAIVASVLLAILAVKEIINLDVDIKRDGKKLAVLAAVMLLVGIVAKSTAKASSMTGEGGGKGYITTVIGFCILLLMSIHVIKKLSKEMISLGNSWRQLLMLAGIFGVLVVVMKALTWATTVADQTIIDGNKAAIVGRHSAGGAGTIFAICAILLASIYAIKFLANMDVETYKNGLLKLVGVFGAISVLCLAAGTIKSSDGFKSILGIAGVIAVIFVAIGLITMISWDEGLKALGIMGSFLLILAVTLSQLGKLKTPNTDKVVWGMFAIILATGLLIYKLQDIPWQNALAISGSIAAVLVAMGACMKLINKVKIDNNAAAAYAGGLLGIFIIGFILNMLVKDVSAPWQTMLSLSGSIAACLLAMGWAVKQISEVNLPDKHSIQTAIGAYVFGIAGILGIGAILKLLAEDAPPWDQLLSMAGSIALVMLALGKAMECMNSGSHHFSWEAVSGMAVGALACGLIAFALYKAVTSSQTPLNFTELISIATAVSELLVAIAGAMWIISQGGTFTWQEALGMITGAVASGIIAYALYKYTTGQGLTDFNSLISVATAISEVLIAIGTSMAIIKSDEIKSFKLSDAGAMLAGAIAALAIAGILWVATSAMGLDPDACVKTAAGISICLVAIAVMAKIMSTVSGFNDFGEAVGIGSLLAECLGVAWGVAELLKQYASENVDFHAMVATAGGIAVGLASIALMAALVGVIGKFITEENALNGILVLDEFLLNFAGIIAGLAGIKWLIKEASGGKISDSDIEQFLDSGGSTLIQLGEIIGGFATSMISGGLQELSKALIPIGENLSKFMEKITPALGIFAIISDDILAGATAISGLILALGASELMSSVSNLISWLTGKKEDDIGEKLVSFGRSMTKFYIATKIIKDAEHFKTVAEAGKTLMEMAAYAPNEGGIVGWFMGENDIGAFGEKIVTFAESMVTVSEKWADINTSMYEKVCQNAKHLIDLACYVPNSGGVVGWFMGENDIDDFGRRIRIFSRSLQVVSQNWADIDTSMYEEVCKNAKYIIDLAGYIPNTGGVAGFLMGDNDVATFGLSLQLFSSSLKTVSDNFEGVDVNKFQSVATAMTSMLAIAKYIKDNGLGKNGWLIKDNSLSDFGAALVNFSESIRIITTEKLQFVDRFKTMVDYIDGFITKVVPEMNKFTGQTFITFLTNLGQKGEEGIKKFLDAFKNAEQNVKTSIATLFSTVTAEMLSETKKNLIESAGRITMTRFSEAFNSEESHRKIAEELNRVASYLYDTMVRDEGQRATVVNLMKQAGRQAAYGFAEGLTDERALEEVRRGGSRLGNEAYESARRSLDEHSPSRKMMEVGSFAGEGFVLGFLEWAKAASNAGGNIGESAQDGLKEALNNLGKEIQNDDELISPVITPILDLTDIEKNASAISGLLNTDKTVTLAAGAGLSFAGGINNLLSNIQASIPDNTNDDVVLAINGLRDDLNVLSARVNNLQVVMDTGELVGVITDPIDSQLGWNSVLAERGVR